MRLPTGMSLVEGAGVIALVDGTAEKKNMGKRIKNMVNVKKGGYKHIQTNIHTYIHTYTRAYTYTNNFIVCKYHLSTYKKKKRYIKSLRLSLAASGAKMLLLSPPLLLHK